MVRTPTIKKDSMKCPECGSSKTVKCGFNLTRKGNIQRYQCKDCARVFQEGG